MRLVILGGGGHGAVVAEAAQATGRFEVVGFLDDDPSRRGAGGLVHLGSIAAAWACPGGIEGMALGVGSPDLRRRWLRQGMASGLMAPPIVHPQAWISPSARLDHGVVVMAGVVIQARAVIGAGTIINTGASVDHDCRVGAHVHIAPGARLAGEVVIDDEGIIGMMASVIEGRRVGARALVAAGAVVVRDILADMRVAGVPARPMGSVYRS